MSTNRDATPLIVIVASSTETPARRDQRLQLLRSANDQNLRVLTRRVVSTRSRATSQSGRPAHLLEPVDAAELYRQLHKQPTAVVQLASCSVALNPQKGADSRNLISLERFVRHKALHLAPDPTEQVVADVAAEINEWIALKLCDGESDARCLPLHLFAPGREWRDLATDQSVRDFSTTYGRQTERTDESGRLWQRASAFHSSEIDCVAGTDLAPGFHWDVQSGTNASHLYSSDEVWRFARGSYANIYPNANVRRGASRGKSASLVFKARRPQVANEATPTVGTSRRKKRSRR